MLVECPSCGYDVSIRADGMVRAHRLRSSDPEHCPGTGTPPVPRKHVHVCRECGARWDEHVDG